MTRSAPDAPSSRNPRSCKSWSRSGARRIRTDTGTRKSDAKLLIRIYRHKEAPKKLPIIADPDPDTIWRVELFYNAIGLAIETPPPSVMISPMLKMSHEGFGRMVLIGGRLIVVNKQLRDVHRFGFDTYAKLAEEGEKMVKAGVEMIEQFPEAANY